MIKQGLIVLLMGLVCSPAIASYYHNPFKRYNVVPTEQDAQNTSITSASSKQSNVSTALYNPKSYPHGRPTLECVVDAAQAHSVPVDLLLAIQSIERGETGQSVLNTNSTSDLGAFQINSIHLPRIQSMGGSKDDLLNKGCYNAQIAALLLKEVMSYTKRQSDDFYTKAARYHSSTPKYNQRYRTKLVDFTKQWQSWLRANGMGHFVTSP